MERKPGALIDGLIMEQHISRVSDINPALGRELRRHSPATAEAVHGALVRYQQEGRDAAPLAELAKAVLRAGAAARKGITETMPLLEEAFRKQHNIGMSPRALSQTLRDGLRLRAFRENFPLVARVVSSEAGQRRDAALLFEEMADMLKAKQLREREVPHVLWLLLREAERPAPRQPA